MNEQNKQTEKRSAEEHKQSRSCRILRAKVIYQKPSKACIREILEGTQNREETDKILLFMQVLSGFEEE